DLHGRLDGPDPPSDRSKLRPHPSRPPVSRRLARQLDLALPGGAGLLPNFLRRWPPELLERLLLLLRERRGLSLLERRLSLRGLEDGPEFPDGLAKLLGQVVRKRSVRADALGDLRVTRLHEHQELVLEPLGVLEGRVVQKATRH